MKRVLCFLLAFILAVSAVMITAADVGAAADGAVDSLTPREQFYVAYDYLRYSESAQIDAVYDFVDRVYGACDDIRSGMIAGNYMSTEYLYVCLRIIRSSLEKIVYNIEYMSAASVSETTVADDDFIADMKDRQREIDSCIARIGAVTDDNLIVFSGTPLYRSYARHKRDSVESIIAGLSDLSASARAVKNMYSYIDNYYIKAADAALSEKLNQLLEIYPSETSYFSVGKIMCLHHNMEENECCMLKSVLIDSGMTWWNDPDFEDGFACQGFARYAYKYMYGTNWSIAENRNLIKINDGNGRAGADFYKDAKTGDLLSLSGHYAIFISADDEGITLYHANYGGSSENLGYVAYHHRPYDTLSASWESTEIYRCKDYARSLLSYQPLESDFAAVSELIFEK